MGCSWEDFRKDFMIGAKRAPRDFFAPVVGLYRWTMKRADVAAERNIREALGSRDPREEDEK